MRPFVNHPNHHLSVRVPWNDTGWGGQVCSDPTSNTSCMVLGRIHEERDDLFEVEAAGRPFLELAQSNRPPCWRENGAFLSAEELVDERRHEYAKGNNEIYNHLQPTKLVTPPNSLMAVPFRWTLKEKAHELAERHQIDVRWEREDELSEQLGWKNPPAWMQDRDNQLAMLDTFFGALEPRRSLVFLYAKAIPLIDQQPGQRILMGWVGSRTSDR